MMHQGGAGCARRTIKLYVGNVAHDVIDVSLEDEHNHAENEFLAHKNMTVEEANIVGRVWRESALEEWEKGVKEKHLSRAESRRIAESEMFPPFIKGVINPYWETFQHCEFEAQEGLMEIGLQLERSKLRVLRNSSEPLFGPREAVDEDELLRRKMVAEKGRICWELLKSTQLVLDLLNWRKADLRIAEQEGEDVYESDVTLGMREKKLKTLEKRIARLAMVVRPLAPEAPERTIGRGHRNRKGVWDNNNTFTWYGPSGVLDCT
jgi:hypothetical protein